MTFMDTLLRAGLSNAVSATFLALLVSCVSRPLARWPAIVHGLWILVLLKLITPPCVEVPVPWPVAPPPAAPIRAGLTVVVPAADAGVPAYGEALEAPREIAV